eukprot:1639750-Amphidinium_carterae.1
MLFHSVCTACLSPAKVGLTRLQTRKLQQAALSAIGGTVDGTPVAGPAPRLSVSSPPGAGPQACGNTFRSPTATIQPHIALPQISDSNCDVC